MKELYTIKAMKTLKLILLLLLLSCRKDVKENPIHEVKTYKYQIEFGKHSPTGLNFRTHNEKTGFDFTLTLNNNCLYNLGTDDNYDINKAYGYTWGFDPENNSFRIGWNCQRQNGRIQYFYYTHNFKLRNPGPSDPYDKTFLFESVPGVRHHFWGEFLRWPGAIRIYSSGYAGYRDIPFNFKNVPLWGVYNYPYFGGDQTAPHRMNFTVEE
jgi:hypothetical protein